MIKAVVDRFEGEYAILLVGDGKQRMSVPRRVIPVSAKEGDWLQVEIENGEIKQATLDSLETIQAKDRIAEKLERLRRGEHLKKGK